MPLGKSAALFVRGDVFDIEIKTGQVTDAELGGVVMTNLDANIKTAQADITGTAFDPAHWYYVCKTDMNDTLSRQNIDTTDSCSGAYGSSTPGTPEFNVTWTSNRKVGTNFLRWQKLLQQKFIDAELNTGEFTALVLDSIPVIASVSSVLPGQALARGRIFVAKVFNLSTTYPISGAIATSYEIRPSGDSSYNPPVREIEFA